MEIMIRRITDEEFLKAFKIRRVVFVEEQKVEPAEEYDEFEDTSVHYLAEIDGIPVGTARWREVNGKIKLERFAVLAESRGLGVGTLLVKKVLENVLDKGKPVYLHAQLQVIPFYEKLGFVVEGPVFEEANILHRTMFFNIK
jgi:predicted GNAT family N-acyltransferase